jgi:hypothetical protein
MTDQSLPRVDVRPPISSLAPPCPRCGHSGFVHADGGDHECLYAECLCSDLGANVRALRPRREAPDRTVRIPEAEEESNGRVAILARKGGAIVSVSLPEDEVDEHVERLSNTGWLVELTAARG